MYNVTALHQVWLWKQSFPSAEIPKESSQRKREGDGRQWAVNQPHVYLVMLGGTASIYRGRVKKWLIREQK